MEYGFLISEMDNKRSNAKRGVLGAGKSI